MMVHACKFTTRDIETEESQVQNHLGDLVSSRPTWDGFDLRCFSSVKSEALPPGLAGQEQSAPALSLASRPGYKAAPMFTSLLPRHRNRLRHRLLTKR